MIERTLVIIKPDAVQRGLIGEIMSRIEKKGLKIVGARFEKIAYETAEIHYGEHKEKSFYPPLMEFITSSPSLLLVIEGNRAVESVRNIVGKTNGVEAEPGSIRGDLGSSKVFNLIHASDSLESSGREIELFFEEGDIVPWNKIPGSYISKPDE